MSADASYTAPDLASGNSAATTASHARGGGPRSRQQMVHPPPPPSQHLRSGNSTHRADTESLGGASESSARSGMSVLEQMGYTLRSAFGLGTDEPQVSPKNKRRFETMQIFDICISDFQVGLDRDGSFQLQVSVDHPDESTDRCFSTRCSPKAKVSRNMIRRWWDGFETDVMYQTKVCGAVLTGDFPHSGWVETDPGLAAKNLTFIVKGEGMYAQAKIPLGLFFSGPIYHAFYLYDGDTVVGRIYYKALANHLGGAGLGMGIDLERFEILQSSFPPDESCRGEIRWRDAAIKTEYSRFGRGVTRELSNQKEGLQNKGEALFHLSRVPMVINVKLEQRPDSVLTATVDMREFITSRRTLYGNKTPLKRSAGALRHIDEKGESLLGFQTTVRSQEGYTADVFVQFDVVNPPKYAQMSGGILTQSSPDYASRADSIVVHWQAFCNPVCDMPFLVEEPSDAVRFFHDGRVKDPEPLMWGLPLPSLRDDEPIPIIRSDGRPMAVPHGGAYFCREFLDFPLPVNWSVRYQYFKDGETVDDSPLAGAAGRTATAIFTDHEKNGVLAGQRRVPSTQVPPSLPDRWCARLGVDGAMTFCPEGSPEEAQAYPPLCIRGYTCAPLPPSWASSVVREGPHKGTVFYIEKTADDYLTSWVPPHSKLVVNQRRREAGWCAFARASKESGDGVPRARDAPEPCLDGTVGSGTSWAAPPSATPPVPHLQPAEQQQQQPLVAPQDGGWQGQNPPAPGDFHYVNDEAV